MANILPSTEIPCSLFFSGRPAYYFSSETKVRSNTSWIVLHFSQSYHFNNVSVTFKTFLPNQRITKNLKSIPKILNSESKSVHFLYLYKIPGKVVCATAFLTLQIGRFATDDTANCPDEHWQVLYSVDWSWNGSKRLLSFLPLVALQNLKLGQKKKILQRQHQQHK